MHLVKFEKRKKHVMFVRFNNQVLYKIIQFWAILPDEAQPLKQGRTFAEGVTVVLIEHCKGIPIAWEYIRKFNSSLCHIKY